ncbi:MAG: hypothetical protein M1570_05960 [Chloroflexi bacterium]|nr:hypothetical protein [Chloroflexota bacterium]
MSSILTLGPSLREDRALSAAYLKAPAQLTGVAAVLMFALLYQLLASPYDLSGLIFLGLLLALLLVYFGAPRALVYLIFAGVLVAHLFAYTQIISTTPAFQGSTRDKAVLLTTQAFLRGENAWNHIGELGVAATTGPASILFASPFVALFGGISWLTFLFWVTFFSILLFGDVLLRNNSFFSLSLLFLLGVFGFTHTLEWRLDELYYPYLFMALAYFCLVRGHWLLAGISLLITILFRPNYVFMAGAFLLWFFWGPRFSRAAVARISIGMALGAVVVLVPFAIVGRGEFLRNNSLLFAFSTSGQITWPDSDPFRVLNSLAQMIGSGASELVRLSLSALLVTGVAWRLRGHNISHPFWHIAVAAFVAHTLIWFPFQIRLAMDYALIFILPAFMAVAFEGKRNLARIGAA